MATPVLVHSAFSGDLGAVTTIPITITSSSAGNTLMVFITGEPGAEGVTSVTDNAGNVYSQVPNSFILSPYDTETAEIWYTSGCAAGATVVTVHWASSTPESQAAVAEFSGLGNAPTVSGAVTSANPGSAVGPVMTPTVINSVAVAFYVPVSFATSVNSPWTILPSWAIIAYYINPPLSAQHAVFTPSTSQNFIADGAIFAPGSSTRTVFGAGGFTSQA